MRTNIKKYLCAVWIMALSFPAFGQTLNEARELYKAGKYKEAAPVFKAELKKKPRDGSFSHWYGVCLFEEGKYEEAEPFLKIGEQRKIQESSRYLAEAYMNLYRFDEAVNKFEAYKTALTKNKMQIPETLNGRLESARKAASMINRVEAVQIIDSLEVDADDFFRHYKLSPESGTFYNYNDLKNTAKKVSTAVYMPQRADKMLYGYPTDTAGYELYQQNKLVGDQWSEPVALPSNINGKGDQNYPFLMSDGLTLYYASNGPGSIGGYDIFVTRNSLDKEAYLLPENVGMPFNSPYNDYLMAIDEMHNVGWFVTDRKQIPGKLTVYLFIPNEEKNYYEGKTAEELRSLARINSIKDTWRPGADYSALLESIRNMDIESVQKKADFYFPLYNGMMYHYLDDFRSNEARNLYVKAQETNKTIDSLNEKLRELRRRYMKFSGSKKQQTSTEILTLENSLIQLNGEPARYENEARKAEQKYIMNNRKK